MISLSFVATQRYFPTRIWPQLMAILSVVWGISAFGGPLFGGLVDTFLTWRWAFGIFAVAALIFAAASLVVLRDEKPAENSDVPGNFPWLALACLAAGVMAIAAAGVETRMQIAMALIAFGFAGVFLFFRLDARSGHSRLFPTATFNPRTTIGSGMIMVAALSVSTCSFGFYGPLLLAGLHDFTPLTTGLIIASESIAWSILSILVATASARYEPLIVTGGAIMVTAGIAGFAIHHSDGLNPWNSVVRPIARRRLRHSLALRKPANHRGGAGRRTRYCGLRLLHLAKARLRDRRSPHRHHRQCQRLLGRLHERGRSRRCSSAFLALSAPGNRRLRRFVPARGAETVGDGLGFVLILPLLQNTFAMVNTSETVCRQYERTAALA